MTTKNKGLHWDKLKVKLEITENVTTFTDTALCFEHPDTDLWYSEGSDNGKRGGERSSLIALPSIA